MKLRYIILAFLLSWTSTAYCSPPKIQISGTLKANDEQVAYIQGKIYHINDAISGYTITDINDQGITIQQPGDTKIYFVGIGDSSNVRLADTADNRSLANSDTKRKLLQTYYPKPTSSFSKDRSEQVLPEILPKHVSKLTGHIIEIFFIAGIITFIVGTIKLIIAGFHESIWWGLLVLLVPTGKLIFLIMRWRGAAKPFGIAMSGVALCFVGVAIGLVA